MANSIENSARESFALGHLSTCLELCDELDVHASNAYVSSLRKVLAFYSSRYSEENIDTFRNFIAHLNADNKDYESLISSLHKKCSIDSGNMYMKSAVLAACVEYVDDTTSSETLHLCARELVNGMKKIDEQNADVSIVIFLVVAGLCHCGKYQHALQLIQDELIKYVSGETNNDNQFLSESEFTAIRVYIYILLNRYDLASDAIQELEISSNDSCVSQYINALLILVGNAQAPCHESANAFCIVSNANRLNTLRETLHTFNDLNQLYAGDSDSSSKQSIPLLNNSAIASMYCQEYTKAEKLLLQAFNQDPYNPSILSNLVCVYRNLQNDSQSNLYFKKLEMIHPQHEMIKQTKLLEIALTQ